MYLSDIYIYTLKGLNGFNKECVRKAIELAKNDVVETDEDFIDFINFNIEDNKFPGVSHPYDIITIRKALEEAHIMPKGEISHYDIMRYFVAIGRADAAAKFYVDKFNLPAQDALQYLLAI